MKICLRSRMVTEDPATRVAYCKETGITAVQESVKSMPSALARGWPTAEELREYRKPFDDGGIEIVGVEPAKEPLRSWVEDTPEGRESFELFGRHLDAAGAAGIPFVSLHPPLDTPTSSQEEARNFDRNLGFYARAVERARAAGTRLATHSPWPPRKGLWGAKEFGALFEAVPEPENGMIFCFGCMAIAGHDVAEVVPRFVDRAFMVHVRDVVIHPDGQIDEVFPGTGQVRPDRALRKLHEVGYRGPIAPEHLPVVLGEAKSASAMAWAVGYCRAVLNDLGR